MSEKKGKLSVHWKGEKCQGKELLEKRREVAGRRKDDGMKVT